VTIAMLAVSTPRFVWTSDRPAFVGADTLLSERSLPGPFPPQFLYHHDPPLSINLGKPRPRHHTNHQPTLKTITSTVQTQADIDERTGTKKNGRCRKSS